MNITMPVITKKISIKPKKKKTGLTKDILKKRKDQKLDQKAVLKLKKQKHKNLQVESDKS